MGAFHARAKTRLSFTVIFYGLKYFVCKTAQFGAMRRKSQLAEIPSVRNGAQASENARKNSFLNCNQVTFRALVEETARLRRIWRCLVWRSRIAFSRNLRHDEPIV
jgi:hypothetical protein